MTLDLSTLARRRPTVIRDPRSNYHYHLDRMRELSRLTLNDIETDLERDLIVALENAMVIISMMYRGECEILETEVIP